MWTKMISRIFALMLLVWCTGCANGREIKYLSKYMDAKDRTVVLDNGALMSLNTVDDVLKWYFTDDAYEAIKDIPVINGPLDTGYASGVNIWTDIASFLTLNGVGRKVVLHENKLKMHGLKSIIHEYVHHLDDMTRDGTANFIDYDEFFQAYISMSRHRQFGLDTIEIEKLSNRWYTDLFGVGEIAEHIAYTGDFLLRKSYSPMEHVFRKIFRHCKERK